MSLRTWFLSCNDASSESTREKASQDSTSTPLKVDSTIELLPVIPRTSFDPFEDDTPLSLLPLSSAADKRNLQQSATATSSAVTIKDSSKPTAETTLTHPQSPNAGSHLSIMTSAQSSPPQTVVSASASTTTTTTTAGQPQAHSFVPGSLLQQRAEAERQEIENLKLQMKLRDQAGVIGATRMLQQQQMEESFGQWNNGSRTTSQNGYHHLRQVSSGSSVSQQGVIPGGGNGSGSTIVNSSIGTPQPQQQPQLPFGGPGTLIAKGEARAQELKRSKSAGGIQFLAHTSLSASTTSTALASTPGALSPAISPSGYFLGDTLSPSPQYPRSRNVTGNSLLSVKVPAPNPQYPNSPSPTNFGDAITPRSPLSSSSTSPQLLAQTHHYQPPIQQQQPFAPLLNFDDEIQNPNSHLASGTKRHPMTRTQSEKKIMTFMSSAPGQQPLQQGAPTTLYNIAASQSLHPQYQGNQQQQYFQQMMQQQTSTRTRGLSSNSAMSSPNLFNNNSGSSPGLGPSRQQKPLIDLQQAPDVIGPGLLTASSRNRNSSVNHSKSTRKGPLVEL